MEKHLGKVEQNFLENVIAKQCGAEQASLRVKPQFGVDVAVIELAGGQVMAITSDPLSLIPSLGLAESAWLSVHLLANDMATTGFSPMFAQFVLNLPDWFSKSDFQTYWGHIHQFCKEIGVAITGGHTGFIEGQNSTIAGGGTFWNFCPADQILTTTQLREGDVILVTKQSAISSVAILAMSFPQTIQNKLGKEVQQKAAEMFYQTSSLKDALAASNGKPQSEGISAMHDVTEGGILGAIYEMVSAADKGVLVYDNKIPADETIKAVCGLFELDYRYCVGAGSMIIACSPEKAESISKRLQRENIPCTQVGEVKNKSFGKKLLQNDKLLDMPYFDTDPYWQAFFKALQSGWK
ncbi:AIR synthase family protein [Raineya orbicola]|uniref:Hydrogenase maturation factor n=1 Tax=Raineya orbicola TaxID=2016530 RepID=A0A2N3IDC7_9BACT|nr:AIR synthase family protein [Raineya orbicola]PKQ68300.1 Hydrogenase maturation factor [Raineya orbicola]